MKSRIFSSLIFFFCLSIASGAGLSETPCRESLGLGSNDEVGFKSVTLTEKIKAAWAEILGDTEIGGRLDVTGAASFTGDIDVVGDVGAATVNGVAPLTSAEKTQALVGSNTISFVAKNIEVYGGAGISVLAGSNSTNTQTNSTNKIMRFGVPHYLAAEEPMAVVFADSGNAENKLCFGGATAQMNAATSIHFFTAPNSTTTTGSSCMTIKGTGIINIDQTPTYADNAAAKSGGLVAGDIYRTSTGVLMIVY